MNEKRSYSSEFHLYMEVPKSLTEYVDAVEALRRKIETDGCPGCGANVETRKSTFWFLEWDEWICRTVKTVTCPFDSRWNYIFNTFEYLRKQNPNEKFWEEDGKDEDRDALE